MNDNFKCDFCEENDSVGIFLLDYAPASLNFCEKCKYVDNLRTKYFIINNYIYFGDEFLKKDLCAYFKGNYIKSFDFIKNLTKDDIENICGDDEICKKHFIEKLFK